MAAGETMAGTSADDTLGAANTEETADVDSEDSPAGERQPGDSLKAAESGETLGSTRSGEGNLEKDPSEWVSGEDPITEAQRSYLDTLARQAGEELPANLTKAEASAHIDRLKPSN